MLRGLDAHFRWGVALTKRRHPGAVFVLSIVAAFLVERQEAREEHDLAGRTKHRMLPVPSVSSAVVRSSRAEAI